MSILVTGGAGFIGSHIVDFLLERGHKVVVLDNMFSGKHENMAHNMSNPDFTFCYGDIADLNTVRSIFIKHNVKSVCHQAAVGSVPRSVDDPLTSHNTNVNGFLNILIVMKELGVKRIVYASSSSVYGDNTQLPKVEDYIGKPLSPYAITKYIDELYANIFSKLYDLECIGLRYFNVFGARQDPNSIYSAVIPKFITKILNNEQVVINGDGSFSRDFTHVSNVVNANYLALTTDNDKCFREVFNIGLGGCISILELYNIISDSITTFKQSPSVSSQLLKNLNNINNVIFAQVRNGDVPHSNASIDKAKELLQYNPVIDFNEGIRLTVKHFIDKL